MDSRTEKMLRQAGKYFQLGKLTLALEQYQKIHEFEPEDTTIMNTIADLYVRLDDKDNALAWYHKLAEVFEFRELHSNATAVYRRILRLTPKNHEAMMLLAQLYERQGDIQNAKIHYQMLAKLKTDLNGCAEAAEILKKTCELDPRCTDSRTLLAQAEELNGNPEAAVKAYLTCLTILAENGNQLAATRVSEQIFRLRPTQTDVVMSFFQLLRKFNLSQRGIDYLADLGLSQDANFKRILAETFLENGNFEAAQELVQGCLPDCPILYDPALKVLEGLIERRNLDASLKLVEELLPIAIQKKDEPVLKGLLDSLLDLDPSNVCVLKTLTTVLIRINNGRLVQEYLTRLALIQLRANELRDARDTLNKLVIYGDASLHLDLLTLLDEGAADPSANLSLISKRIVHALELGRLDREVLMPDTGLALGVSELDLGIGLNEDGELQFV